MYVNKGMIKQIQWADVNIILFITFKIELILTNAVDVFITLLY